MRVVFSEHTVPQGKLLLKGNWVAGYQAAPALRQGETGLPERSVQVSQPLPRSPAQDSDRNTLPILTRIRLLFLYMSR